MFLLDNCILCDMWKNIIWDEFYVICILFLLYRLIENSAFLSDFEYVLVKNENMDYGDIS